MMKRARTAVLGFLEAERETVAAFLFSRLLIWAIAWLAFHSVRHDVLPLDSNGSELWNMLLRWDANWYRSIAEGGYQLRTGQSNVNFFPLYPLSVRFVCWLTKASTPLAGFLASNIFFLAAVVLLRRLVTLDFPEPSKVPARTVWLCLLYPVTFFYSSMYTESLYLLLSLGAFFAARKGRWAYAGIAGALLTATRSNGLFIMLPLVWEAVVETRRFPLVVPEGWLRSRWWLLLVPAGLVAFSLFLGLSFGDPLVFVHGQAAWGRGFATPWNAIRGAFLLYDDVYLGLFLGTEFIAVALLLLAVYLKLRTSYLIYTAALLLLFCSMTLLEGLPRYVSVLFPLQVGLAALTARFNEALYLAILVASTATMVLCLVLFTGGYWMT